MSPRLRTHPLNLIRLVPAKGEKWPQVGTRGIVERAEPGLARREPKGVFESAGREGGGSRGEPWVPPCSLIRVMPAKGVECSKLEREKAPRVAEGPYGQPRGSPALSRSGGPTPEEEPGFRPT